MTRCLALLFFASLLCANAFAQVKATLVAAEAAMQPGRPFTVALRLEHDPHWHTYWINPGTGYPTSLKWELPAGWQASEIQWPTPIVIKDSRGTITGNGYEGDTLLPVTLTPPPTLAAGTRVVLRAKAEWLMCADTCIPGEAEVELTLLATNEPPQPDPTWRARFAEIAAPQPLSGWTAHARGTATEVTLSLKRTAPNAPPLQNPHFFSDDAFIQYDQPQKVSTSADGYELVLPVSPSIDKRPARVTGVLATQAPFGGWQIDVPLEESAGGAASGANSTASTGPARGLPGTLLLAFLGGLILNLMPCVFPVLGIKVLGFVQQAGADRRKVTLHGVAFTVGVLLSFWTLAAALALLRAGGDQLGWGFQLQSAPFVFCLAAVMLVFALSLSGVFEFGLRATAIGGNLQMKTGYSGSFFTGVLATIVATPCSAPFLAPALGAALALPTAESFVVFTVVALGLSTPYLLLSIFPHAVRWLPRPGGWMETFKEFMAFPLYATVGFLVWVLAGQTTEGGLLAALFGLTAIALAAWLYGRFSAPGASDGRVRFAQIGGLLVLALGIWIGWPEKASAGEIVWQPWSAEAVAQARAQKKTVYVDFTARWCATCQTNKKIVFGSAEVRKHIHDTETVTLKADWTNKDPLITAELARYSRSAVPFNLVYRPDRPEPIVLPEVLTPGTVLDALR